MGASLGGGELDSGGGRRRKRRAYKPMAEINVTPFVDVMLVLLIVFMVTAPLLTVGVPIELPKTNAKQLNTPKKEPLTITIDGKGRIFLQKTEVKVAEIEPKLKAITESGFNEEIYILGDVKAQHGVVAKVLGAINAAGFTRINIVTDS
ncbi:MAG: ExbD/TolR family protein [Methyloligellaceae bacterium]